MDNTPLYQLYFNAMNATTEAEAEGFLQELIELAIRVRPELSYEEARAIQLSNVGYFTGYLSELEQQRRVLRLYHTEHPIFGAYQSEVTPDKAMAAGMALGAASKEGKLTASAIAAARKIIEEP